LPSSFEKYDDLSNKHTQITHAEQKLAFTYHIFAVSVLDEKQSKSVDWILSERNMLLAKHRVV